MLVSQTEERHYSLSVLPWLATYFTGHGQQADGLSCVTALSAIGNGAVHQPADGGDARAEQPAEAAVPDQGRGRPAAGRAGCPDTLTSPALAGRGRAR
jgi:hypothetical protein